MTFVSTKLKLGRRIPYSDLFANKGKTVAVVTPRGVMTGKLDTGAWSGDLVLDQGKNIPYFYIEPRHKVYEL